MTKWQKLKLKEYLENPKYCACGCKNIIMPDFNYKGFYIMKFIRGHLIKKGRYSPRYGKKHTKKAKEKVSKGI